VGVNVGPPGVTVRVGVKVGVNEAVMVGDPVGVGVDVGVNVGPPGVTVIVGVGVGPPATTKQAENSDVVPGETISPRGAIRRTPLVRLGGPTSVAVAVIACPGTTTVGTVTVKLPLPVPSVTTFEGVACPRNVCPSPFPEGSHAVFEKNCRKKDVLGVLFSVPWIVVNPAPGVTAVITGKFCSPLGPVSASPASFGVTPSKLRSIPRFAFE
jgi:hypothetical protein